MSFLSRLEFFKPPKKSEDGNFLFEIDLDGIAQKSVVNQNPEIFHNVKMFAMPTKLANAGKVHSWQVFQGAHRIPMARPARHSAGHIAAPTAPRYCRNSLAEAHRELPQPLGIESHVAGPRTYLTS